MLVRGDIDEFEEFYQMFLEYYSTCPMEVKKEDQVLTLENIPVIFEIENEKGEVIEESRILGEKKITFSNNSVNKPIIFLSIDP